MTAAAVLLVLLAGGAATDTIPAPSDTTAARFEDEITHFEASDREHPPKPGGVLFLGSSSIRMWDTLAADFPGSAVLNRGFGGSEISDVRHYASRIVLPHRPRLIVFYAGDNDINAGKSARQVLADYMAFTAWVHDTLPETRVAFIAIKPSLARRNLMETMREANRLVAEFSGAVSWLDFIDVFTPMLGPDGEPRPELFLEDGLHLNARGYALWTSIVRPLVSAGRSGRTPEGSGR